MTVLALTLKATLTLLVALGIAAAAKHARASMRHLVVSVSFVLLLLLPLASLVMPSVLVPVPAKATWARAVAPIMDAAPAPAPAPLAVPPPPSRRQLDLALLLAGLYAAGVVVGSTRLVRGLFLLRGIAHRGEVWLEGMTRMNELALAAGIRRAVLVVASGEVSVPLTFGFRRQTIVVPAAAKGWSAEALRRAIRHELEHVRRDDWALQLIAQVARILYWPHPLVWIAWRRLQLEAEIAADDAVLTSPGDLAADGTAYADQLLALARVLGRRHPLPAMSMASASSLSSRIESILAARAARGPVGRFAATMAIACTVTVLAAVAPVRVVAAALDDPESLIESIGNDSPLAEALIQSAERGRIDDVAQLLDAGLDVNTNLRGDGTALLVATRHGHLSLVNFLLERGADVNLASPGDGNPLIVAAQTGRVDLARYLLDRGARIDEVVPGDENPLIAASEGGHLDVVRLLLAHGANPSTRVWADDREWRSPLIMARRGGHDAVVRELLAAGAK